jgi:peptide/nickel transport system permease protein
VTDGGLGAGFVTGERSLEILPGAGRSVRSVRALSRFARRKPLGAFAGLIVLLLLFTAAFAPLIAPHGYDDQDLEAQLEAPSWSHPFGTDNLGRDMLSRIIYGCRVTVVVGFGAVALSMLIACVIGVVSGFYGGWVDILLQRLVDIWIAFPALVLLISIISLFKTTDRTHLIAAIGIILAAGSSRVIRSAALSVKAEPYVEAARALGCRDLRILLFYIVPNVVPVVIVLATVQLGAAILVEASISFLGYGIPPPYPTWGQMLGPAQLQLLRTDPYLSLFPGLAIAVAVYSFNILGDAARDVIDPRLRGAT